MIVLSLTAAQAAAVTGETTPGHWLIPLQIGPDQFILSEAVLSDPAHSARHAVLDALPRIDYQPAPSGEAL